MAGRRDGELADRCRASAEGVQARRAGVQGAVAGIRGRMVGATHRTPGAATQVRSHRHLKGRRWAEDKSTEALTLRHSRLLKGVCVYFTANITSSQHPKAV